MRPPGRHLSAGNTVTIEFRAKRYSVHFGCGELQDSKDRRDGFIAVETPTAKRLINPTTTDRRPGYWGLRLSSQRRFRHWCQLLSGLC